MGARGWVGSGLYIREKNVHYAQPRHADPLPICVLEMSPVCVSRDVVLSDRVPREAREGGGGKLGTKGVHISPH